MNDGSTTEVMSTPTPPRMRPYGHQLLIGEHADCADARRKAIRSQRNKQKEPNIVNTGNGKGKTTAALGILTRTWGREMRTADIQLFKHTNAIFGGLCIMQRMGIELAPMGAGFTWTSRNLDKTQAKALHGREIAKARIASGDYDIFLLDKFTYVLHFGWRDAPPELVALADLVTEMREIKHPFKEQGIRAQKGIEF
jgi:cob(I)alamin adenosyltransferase